MATLVICLGLIKHPSVMLLNDKVHSIIYLDFNGNINLLRNTVCAH